ncbi:oligopeptide transporter [Obba rivulosa]|uniref:Oligopeptide transporter n=1 Tax=Obba rivulosa TaxID=1052685 RepID=A0A8E2AYT3_9APHY|nr:oligopeptide transporter [Obba rivulosa]
MEYDLDDLAEEDSPYPEVRASVSNIDDPEMPTLTLRMWVTGLVLTIIAGAANTFFNFRQPAPSIMSTLLLLASHPIGKLFAYWLPITTYRLPRVLGGGEFSLNPGPWNIKEHTLVVMMANVAIGTPYSINIIVVAETNYGIRLGFWFNAVLVLATQLTGFGLAGLCRRFLVWPASMVWPADLVICTMLNTLHAEEDDDRGGISRFKFFTWVASGAFLFFFLPGYLFTALSVFSWVCWIAPDNIPVNQIFGVVSGLGFSVLTFDWTEISWLGSPLVFPWWAEVHVFAGFVLIWWILAPALYYSNVWNLAFFPMLANNPYDKYGNQYNISLVLRPDGTFDPEAYDNYSPLYLPASYAITYLVAFALASCLLVHTVLYYSQAVINGFKRINVEKDDIHAKLMRAYPEVPDWWYAASFCFFFCLAIVAVEVWHTGIPVWCLLLAVALPVLYILPSGYILAMTSQVVTLNLPAQIIPGMLLPGNAFANMVFKSYSIQTLSEAQSFIQDLKLGHYIKVPPRATFMVQLVSTLFVGFVQVGVKEWMFANIKNICTAHQPDFLTCPHNQVLYTASAVWGLIGPTRQFGVGSIYHPQLYALIVGAVLPIPFWLYHRKHPSSWANLINTPILLNGVAYIPPAVGINYSSWFLVGFIFQFIIRRKNFAWWSKFNYVTSAALDSGTSLSVLFIFFALEFPRKGTITVNWWGNSVWQRSTSSQLHDI